MKEGNDAYRNQALTDLNKLRKYRFNKEFPADELNITDGQELLEFIIDERFRELCGETNHRWCDLRRYGLTVTHVLKPGRADVFTGHETLCTAHPGTCSGTKSLFGAKLINV